MRRGQRTFRPVNKEDQHRPTCSLRYYVAPIHRGDFIENLKPVVFLPVDIFDKSI